LFVDPDVSCLASAHVSQNYWEKMKQNEAKWNPMQPLGKSGSPCNLMFSSKLENTET
jgi:hypothetical protein